jgi:hypothetical protein
MHPARQPRGRYLRAMRPRRMKRAEKNMETQNKTYWKIQKTNSGVCLITKTLNWQQREQLKEELIQHQKETLKNFLNARVKN